MSESQLNKIKESIDIIDLAKRLGLEVKHKQARCFNIAKHKNNDNNFSLGFYENNTKYKCFTCGVSGSVVDLYMGVKGVDLKTAIKDLSDITGLEVLPTKRIVEKVIKNTEPLEALAEHCKGVDSETLNYLTGDKRGLTEDTIKRFKLFSIKDYNKTADYLKKLYSEEELKEVGLLNDKENLTFYKHKVVVPFYKAGKIVFIQGRRMKTAYTRHFGKLSAGSVERSLGFNKLKRFLHSTFVPVEMTMLVLTWGSRSRTTPRGTLLHATCYMFCDVGR